MPNDVLAVNAQALFERDCTAETGDRQIVLVPLHPTMMPLLRPPTALQRLFGTIGFHQFREEL